MMDFHSFEIVALDRQAELQRAAATGRVRRTPVLPTRSARRLALPLVLLSRLGRTLIAVGRQLECLDSRSTRPGCAEHTPART